MKSKYLYMIALFLVAACDLESQCLDTLEICYGSTTIINPPLADNTYKIKFKRNNGASSQYYEVVCVDSTIQFDFPYYFGNFGRYEIQLDSFSFCSGYYIASSCTDDLYPVINNNCFFTNDYGFCADSLFSNGYVFGFCINDTTQFTFGEFHGISSKLNEPFYPERLTVINGELIHYNDSTFTIKWNNTGNECLKFRTITEYNDTVYSTISLSIFPTTRQDILLNGIPAEEVTICEGDSLTLSLSNSKETYWSISDGRSYYGEFNKIPFNKSGVYILKAYFSIGCQCTPESEFKIIVSETNYPKINCVRTVCLGEIATYTSQSICNKYDWKISSGGIIVEGGSSSDNYVKVKWISGYENTVTLSTPDCSTEICESPFTANISIINPGVDISGPVNLCDNETAFYEVPEYNGTSYHWTIGDYGVILNGQGTNKIKVKWNSLESVSSNLKVVYNNCNIECNGYAELMVSIKPVLGIKYQNLELCLDQDFTFENTLKDTVKWSIYNENDELVQEAISEMFQFTFTEAGTYHLIAFNTNNTSCNLIDSITLTVKAALNPPAAIIGSKLICLNKTVQYSIIDVKAGEIIYWEIYDGDTIIPAFTSLSTDVLFTWKSNGPYMIKVKKINTITGCESDAKTFEYIESTNIVGDKGACVNSQIYYYVSGYSGENLTWKISPASAGTIITNVQGECWIKWKLQGKHKLSTTICGKSISINVDVSPVPEVKMVYDSKVCFGKKSSLTVNTKADETFAVKQGNVIISTANPTLLGKGKYNIEVNKNGCKSTKTINIDEYARFEINIRILQPEYVCPPFEPLDLYVVYPKDTYSYQWYFNGLPFGANAPAVKAGKIGSYHLVVTDINGCTSKSNVETIYECCDDVLLSPANLLDVKVQHDNCVTKSFSVVPPFESTKFNWNFGDNYFSNNNYATGTKVKHTFSKAGLYFVWVNGDANCDTVSGFICSLPVDSVIQCEYGYAKVTIPVVADFYAFNGCTDKAVSFHNISTKLPTEQNIYYNWNFGDPSSGSSNTSIFSNPTHKYKEPGNYIVTLIAKVSSGCSDTITKSIYIEKTPKVNIISEDEICYGDRLYVNYQYEDTYTVYQKWNFDDPNSDNKNTSSLKSSSHVFTAPGTYIITLTAESLNGCSDTDTKKIIVHGQFTTGEISCDIPLPKCPDDIATLKAPAGNFKYKWSNGDTTQSIKVKDPLKYSLTITNSLGCQIKDKSFTVYNHDIFRSRIYAKKFNSNSGFITIYDSITICKGDSFNILVSKYPNATYEWSNGYKNGYELKYDEFFKNLSAGHHEISVKVYSLVDGCEMEVKSFVIHIKDAPEKPDIFSLGNRNCDNEEILLYLGKKEAGATYKWNNELDNDTIKVKNAGTYFVMAKNELGCQNESNKYVVHPSPKSNEWLTGCMEVCLPKDFCINFNEHNIYQLLHNGVISDTINTSSGLLSLGQTGDYQVKIFNEHGCSVLSDYLSLSKKPNLHSVSGVVYYDVDEDDEFDSATDILLNDVNIIMKKDSTIYHTTKTDSLGIYSFDSLLRGDLNIEVAIEDLEYTLIGETDSLLLYEKCLENKLLNFPLRKNCKSRKTTILAEICHGTTTFINGKEYKINDVDTLTFPVSKNCDSTVIIKIEERARPSVILDTEKSCTTDNSGELHLNIVSGNIVQYILDQSPVSITNDTIKNLAPGQHKLVLINNFGCKEEYDFTIDSIQSPEFLVEVTSTCLNENIGTLKVQVPNNNQLKFSIDHSVNYHSNLSYDSLSAGSHSLFVKDTFGCVYQKEFIINTFPQPEFTTSVKNTCQDKHSGALQLISNQTLKYGLNQKEVFNDTSHYNALGIGNYTVYAQNESGCIDSNVFKIEYLPLPVYNATVENTCSNLNGGNIVIDFNPNDKLRFKMSKDSVFDTLEVFVNLKQGQYEVFIQDSFGCEYKQHVIIDTLPAPKINYILSNSCYGQNNGGIILKGSGSTQQFAINDKTKTLNDTIVGGLTAGDYTIYTSNIFGCKDSVMVAIKELIKPVVEIFTQPNCENAQLGSIRINTSDSTLISLDGALYNNNKDIQNLEKGQYMLYFKSIDNCVYQSPFEILYIPQPVVEIDTKESCEFDSTGSINVFYNNSNILVSINNGDFNDKMEFNNLPPDIYTLRYKNEYGCIYEKSVAINEAPLPKGVAFSNGSCPLLNTGSVKIITANKAEVSLDAVHFTSDFHFENLAPGEYNFIIRDSLGCESPVKASVDKLPDLEVEFPDVILDCEKHTVQMTPLVLSSAGIPHFLWNTGNSDKTLNIFESGSYQVSISDECTIRSNEWQVQFEEFNEAEIIAAPNIFKPFSNNSNNCFKPTPFTNLEIIDYSISIFDRWGNLHFTTKDLQDCWDGNFNGIRVESGVFVYLIDITVLHCNKPKKIRKVGDVTVLH